MKKIIIILLLSSMFACERGTPSELEYSGYQKWLSEYKQDFNKSRATSLLTVSGKYLDSDLLAYQEYSNLEEGVNISLDSLKSSYQCGLSFKITLKANDKTTNLLNYQISDYNDYKERINFLNFKIDQFIQLTDGQNSYKPTLGHFEGYNELSNKLVFNLVFNPESYNCGEFSATAGNYKLTFDDPYWNSGINHFTFDTKKLKNIPDLVLAQR